MKRKAFKSNIQSIHAALGRTWPRFLALLLAAVFALSTVLSGTMAWIDMSQHRTNAAEGEGAPQPAQALLQKYEMNGDGTKTTTPLPGTRFALYRLRANGAADLIDTFVTGQDGKALASDLMPGEYYWQETHPAPGYLPETEEGQPKKYPFTLPGEDGETVACTAYNIRQKGRLAILKTVRNADNTPLTQEQKDLPFEFAIFLDGMPDGPIQVTIDDVAHQLSIVNCQLSIELKSGQTAQIEEIPSGILYEVTETPVQGCTTTSENNAGNVPSQGVTASFINTYQCQYGSLKITKTVTGEDADLAKEFVFSAVIGESNETFRLRHGQSKMFNDIPLGTAYTVAEADYSDQHYIPLIQSYSGGIQSSGVTVTLPFVNHYEGPEPPDLPGGLAVTKTVVGGTTDKAFTFTVTFEGEGAPDSPQEFSLRHGETKTFAELPRGLRYVVTEDPEEGYNPDFRSASGVIAAGQTAAVGYINRAPVLPREDIWLTVVKRVEGNPPLADSEKLFHFTLVINDSTRTFALKPGETSNPLLVSPGDTYALTEQSYAADGYIQSGAMNGSGVVGAQDKKIEIIRTNTYVGPETVDISGEKTWKAPAGTQLPGSATIQLKQGTTVLRTAVVNSGNHWRYTFEGLPKRDALGGVIAYTMEEVPIPGWRPVVTGYNIENRPQTPLTDEAIEVEKTITGAPEEDPEFTFVLTSINGAPMPEEHEITVTGAGRAAFGAITYTLPGEYVYTIAERDESLPNWSYDASLYTLTVMVIEDGEGNLTANRAFTKSGLVADRALFNNRYNTAVETISAGVHKVWMGDEAGERPQSVRVQLYKDGAAYGDPATLSEANNWARVWHELDRQAVWTVKELNVPEGYTAVVTGDHLNGFVVTNTKGAPEVMAVKATKVWKGEDENRPQSVAAQLYKDGEAEGVPVMLSAANGWTYTWNGLEKGAAWSVNEVNTPTGYSKAITGDAANGFVITNTKIASSTEPFHSDEEVLIQGKKTWNHGVNPVAKRPDSITVIIKADGGIVTQRRISGNEHWAWSFLLPKYDDEGREVKYTVDEARFEDYVKTVDGYNLINTYRPGANTDDPDPGKPPKPPTTGDDSNLALWLGLMIGSLACLAALLALIFITRRKQRK